MINLKANNKKFSLPQSWGEITFGMYLKVINTTNDTELIHLLSGLPLHLITGNEANYIPYLEWLKSDIDSKDWKSKHSTDIFKQTLAQLFGLELSLQSNNKIVETIKIYFVDLELESEMLPDVIGLANDLFEQLKKYHENEKKFLYFRATPEQERAGIDKFNPLGRMNTIDSLATRYHLKYAEVEQLEVNTAFGMLLRIKLENDYQRNYSMIMSEKK